MTTKAEKTTQFIIKTVAPIFNKKGYTATSLSDITKATGLTKGAIYGNFDNKETLSLHAFDYNVTMILSRIEQYMEKGNTPLERLMYFVRFYKNYYDFTSNFGGCPIINTAVDAKNMHPELLEKVQDAINKIEGYIASEIEKGKIIGEIRKTIPGDVYGKRFFSLIQGAIFMSQTTNDKSYTTDCLNVIIDTINQRFK
ncbi:MULTISPECIES: TetR/AcrR family transcriptional regulator [Galbibacter]|uniref:TetR/AcrR family transcriptional regulator n=1 Tax=Galbibacter pacificus TaxID=2996052 RepID=A0ABT6FPI7_9FLAO|nr:TetR/AcrR family transcriptional regulator [Galbibacter pacificus]MDG3582343.1 TetR/AcrR family transcriptional regulator [Galbibacter pacificus]MDG3585181.1 TetR/AcrR family transcriptional regulator [Galbibacter pacificus]